MKTFNEMYAVDKLKEKLPFIVGLIDWSCECCEPDVGEMVYVLDLISPWWMEEYQPIDIVKEFGLNIEADDDWVYEFIDEAEGVLTQQAQETLNSILPDHLGVGFGHTEPDGDYGLLLWWLGKEE